MVRCEKCNKEHPGKFGSGRFCSRSCANSRPRPHTLREQVSAKLKGRKTSANMKEVNNRPEKIAKNKKTWINKRDYESAHPNSVKKWIKEDIKHCEMCGITEWRGAPIILEVHHIDGDKYNNVVSNLQVLCPNCHSTTPNWRFKKNKVKK